MSTPTRREVLQLLASATAANLACGLVFGSTSEPIPLLRAIHMVEASGRLSPPDGDSGRAIGPFQIHKVYWLDAVEHEPRLRARGYNSCRDYVYARRVVLAYWSRYASGKTNEAKARIHNGGPRGHLKASTLGYWAKVKAHL